jgi:PhzF family phenazine biosynthesis protein
MKIPLYQVDAFTSRVFGGNPAAVCPLGEAGFLPDAVMQAIGNENNLSETAFLVARGDRYDLRWFTPENEIDLCGHATLASAYVVFTHLRPDLTAVAFDTKSGELLVKRSEGGLLSMDFPSRPPEPGASDSRLRLALGGKAGAILVSRDYLVVYESEEEVRALKPDMNALATMDRMVIVTAQGRECDFVSRFFAPGAGVPEDPVTGSAHCTLIPYWAERLGKTKLHALQVSRRGGELFCELVGDRVTMAGYAVEFMRGEIEIG